MELYPDRFNTDFENNKRVVDEVTDTYSKSLRNRIAGYVTRYIKNKIKEEEREAIAS